MSASDEESFSRWDPTSWAQALARLPPCPELPVAADALLPMQTLEGLGVSLPVPPGGTDTREDDRAFRMRAWTFDETCTMLYVARFPGSRNVVFHFELDGAEAEIESVCGAAVGERPARVSRMRYIADDSVRYGAIVELVREGEALSAAVVAPARSMREELLGHLLSLRIDAD